MDIHKQYPVAMVTDENGNEILIGGKLANDKSATSKL